MVTSSSQKQGSNLVQRSRKRVSKRPTEESQGAWRSKRRIGEQRGKNIMSAARRKELLEADPWAFQVKEHSVICKGCKKRIALDGRSLFYRGLWDKHRGKCPKIEELRQQGISPLDILMSDDEQYPVASSTARVRRTVSKDEPKTPDSGYHSAEEMDVCEDHSPALDTQKPLQYSDPMSQADFGAELCASLEAIPPSKRRSLKIARRHSPDSETEDKKPVTCQLLNTSKEIVSVPSSLLKKSIWSMFPFDREGYSSTIPGKYRYSSLGELRYGYKLPEHEPIQHQVSALRSTCREEDDTCFQSSAKAESSRLLPAGTLVDSIWTETC